MKDLFLICANLLESDIDVVMATIINQGGSAPRTAGSKMLVRRDGSIYGTIGGGIFEAQAIRIAQDVFQSGQSVTRTFTFSGHDVKGMDMICGGEAEIFVDLLRACDVENAAACKAVSDLKNSDRDSRLITKIVTGPASEGQPKLALLAGDATPAGMRLPEEDRLALASLQKERHPQQVTLGDATYLVEPIHHAGTVYIFGAGHISRHLARLTSFIDFRTVVLDDRAEYANAMRFPQADQIIVPDDMETCMKGLPVSKDSYIVIVTRGHAHDRTVLAQALQTDAGYIGMIGSKKKRDAIYQYLRQAGVPEEKLARVHSPIGVDIAAETPEEIAVSIAGELILARAGRNHDEC